MVVRVGSIRAGALSAFLSFSLLAGGSSQAQSPPPAAASPAAAQTSPQPKPVTGFVSSYEIMRTVRTAGFDPLGPPLREGSTYVLRATDFRGILMRVVLDARTGVIRDVTRIVPAESGPYGIIASPYGPSPYPPPYEPPPYGSPAEYDAPAPATDPAERSAPAQLARPASLAPAVRPAVSTRPFSPPLPRPRPAALAAHDPPKVQTRPVTNADAVGANAGAGSVRAAPSRPPPLAPLND